MDRSVKWIELFLQETFSDTFLLYNEIDKKIFVSQKSKRKDCATVVKTKNQGSLDP